MAKAPSKPSSAKPKTATSAASKPKPATKSSAAPKSAAKPAAAAPAAPAAKAPDKRGFLTKLLDGIFGRT